MAEDHKRPSTDDRRRPLTDDGQRVSSVQHLTKSRYALEYGAQRVPLTEGEIVVGRAAECDLVLDSHIVSRRHARFVINQTGVFVEDLGSVNGVSVNGRTITERTRIAPGARIGLADTVLVLIHWSGDERSSRVTSPLGIQPNAATPPAPRPRTVSEERTRRMPALEIAAGVMARALALGRLDDAERLLGTQLRDVLAEATSGGDVNEELVEAAAKYALQLAEATRKSEWADYPVRLYSSLERVLPLAIIDALQRTSRIVRVDGLLLARYASKLAGARLGPADRFALQRVQSLARLCAGR